MTSVFSWQNSVSLCSASFCNPRSNCYSRYLLTLYFCIPVPYDENDFVCVCVCVCVCMCVLILECLVGLHRAIQLQLPCH